MKLYKVVIKNGWKENKGRNSRVERGPPSLGLILLTYYYIHDIIHYVVWPYFGCVIYLFFFNAAQNDKTIYNRKKGVVELKTFEVIYR